MDKYFQVIEKTPFWGEVMENYETEKEELQEQNYRNQMLVKRLKRSM